MKCPFCHKEITEVINSRPTKTNTQIWRRRKCLKCKRIFTTHEVIDLSHLMVIKKSGRTERYSRMKLYSGIYVDVVGKNRETRTEAITNLAERELLSLGKKKISSIEIADAVLSVLRKKDMSAFMKFLAYCKNISSETQMKRELDKYLRS